MFKASALTISVRNIFRLRKAKFESGNLVWEMDFFSSGTTISQAKMSMWCLFLSLPTLSSHNCTPTNGSGLCFSFTAALTGSHDLSWCLAKWYAYSHSLPRWIHEINKKHVLGTHSMKRGKDSRVRTVSSITRRQPASRLYLSLVIPWELRNNIVPWRPISQKNIYPGTYDHRVWKTGLPVRSAVLKPHAGRLVVGWVTTSESRLL